MNYSIIKMNFDKGLWNKHMVGIAVKKGMLTAADYKEITGDEYIF